MTVIGRNKNDTGLAVLHGATVIATIAERETFRSRKSVNEALHAGEKRVALGRPIHE